MDAKNGLRFNRRDVLKYGSAALLGAAAGLPAKSAIAGGGGDASACAFTPDADQLTESLCTGQKVEIEYFPTSPFVLNPFTDPLPVPLPLAPVESAVYDAWVARSQQPSPALGRQASDGDPSSTHSLWPSDIKYPNGQTLPEPIVYHLKLQVGEHRFTSSQVMPIDASGQTVVPPDQIAGPRYLPPSRIWGYNGIFPGPMINARYGRPVVVRFEDQLHKDDPQDFGSPKGQFLTHLHNGHTAPESDGNPHFRPHGYKPGEWVDNLYLNFPAGRDDSEKQSFLWFHDHFEAYTGANVYKGLVGLYPIYDEEFGPNGDSTLSGTPTLDPGDESKALRLPGVRRNLSNHTFQVDYDIPLAIHDLTLDDGVTPHHDFHNGCGEKRADLWGKTFFKHYPDHGFVGDIFGINGTVFPVLHVKRRRYRFRFLDASIARVYKFVLMKSSEGPKPARGTQGQWLLPDGQKALKFAQIASEGGLLPYPILRDSFELWPSRRKEVVVDFTSCPEKELYLVNTAKMEDGRKPDSSDSSYKVPMLKIIIDDGPPPEPDQSLPLFSTDATGNLVPRALRPLPNVDLSDEALAKLPHRSFELQRGGGAGGGGDTDPIEKFLAQEFEWQVNGRSFQVCVPLASPQKDQPEVWHVKNGGGGWVHPMHFHEEEHRIISKNGVRYNTVTPVGPDDVFAKEDTISLGPGEEVVIYRNFRTFPTRERALAGVTAKYVAHCHNLAHEDHSMMFGWQIVDKITT
jgi:FtsP/CotA-like multicopper oxidase with cupredoxin domain